MGITLDLTAMIIVTFCLVLFSAVPSLRGAPGGGDPDLDLESFHRGLHICLQPMFSAYVGYYGYDAAEKLALEMFDYENSKGAAGRSEPLNDIQDIYPLLGYILGISPYCGGRVASYMIDFYSTAHPQVSYRGV